MKLTVREATKRANKGAALLDKKQPGWFATIDLSKLDLDNPRLCVLGQGFKHLVNSFTGDGYDVGVRDLFNDDERAATEFGFNAYDRAYYDPHAYDTLTRVWAKIIKERQTRFANKILNG